MRQAVGTHYHGKVPVIFALANTGVCVCVCVWMSVSVVVVVVLEGVPVMFIL